MNVSFADGQISYSVERAIINQFFTATGTETEPTIIGRFIPGIDGNWSMVAIANLVKNIDGKLLPVSRYFVSEGDTLEHLVNWVETHYQLFDTYPIFEPLQVIPEIANRVSASSQAIYLTEDLKEKLKQKAKENSPLIITKKLPLTAVYQQAKYLGFAEKVTQKFMPLLTKNFLRN
jgi:hypothetical protein